MLMDGIQLVGASYVENLNIEPVTSFPLNPSSSRTVSLTTALPGYPIGIYSYVDGQWKLETGEGATVGGGGAASSGVFILDIVPTGSGIVGQKTYKSTVPANTVISSVVSDTPNIRVLVGASGGLAYSPTVSVNGIFATLIESTTKRWFTGYVDLVLTGDTTITVTSSEGGTDTATVTRASAGPNVTDVSGTYPEAQTAVKAGDVVALTITTELTATSVMVLAGGASATQLVLPVVNGTASGNLIISNASGSQTIQVVAKNSLGTPGATFTSDTLNLDQVSPVIDTITASYPAGQSALKTGETVTLTAAITNADSYSYSGSGLTIPSPAVYAASKLVGHSLTGVTTATYTITATKNANNSVTTKTYVVNVATTAPTAVISISGNPSRLVSSPVGINYTVVLTPSQVPLASAPSLTASAGTWSGSWQLVGNAWQRTLVIADATARGPAMFSGLTLTGPSDISGTTISSGANYTVGGLSARTLTFAAFSRVAALGAAVVDAAKTSAQYTGGAVLTRYTDNTVHQAGFYIANADGSPNATGSYLGLSDTAFAGANSSGTLQVDFAETA